MVVHAVVLVGNKRAPSVFARKVFAIVWVAREKRLRTGSGSGGYRGNQVAGTRHVKGRMLLLPICY